MTGEVVGRDERTTVIENASYRLAFYVFTYGLLALVMYRSFVHSEDSWDLLGLVLLGGFVPVAYQARYHALHRRWGLYAAYGAVVAGVIALLVALVA